MNILEQLNAETEALKQQQLRDQKEHNEKIERLVKEERALKEKIDNLEQYLDEQVKDAQLKVVELQEKTQADLDKAKEILGDASDKKQQADALLNGAKKEREDILSDVIARLKKCEEKEASIAKRDEEVIAKESSLSDRENALDSKEKEIQALSEEVHRDAKKYTKESRNIVDQKAALDQKEKEVEAHERDAHILSEKGKREIEDARKLRVELQESEEKLKIEAEKVEAQKSKNEEDQKKIVYDYEEIKRLKSEYETKLANLKKMAGQSQGGK